MISPLKFKIERCNSIKEGEPYTYFCMPQTTKNPNNLENEKIKNNIKQEERKQSEEGKQSKEGQQSEERKQSEDSKFSLGNALANVYPLLDLIFEYLARKDLAASRKVSKSWYQTSERVLRRRRDGKLGWYYFNRNKGTKTSKNLLFGDYEFGFLFIYENLKDEDMVCYHQKDSEINSEALRWMDVLKREILEDSIPFCLVPSDMIYLRMEKSLLICSYFPKIPGLRIALNPDIEQFKRDIKQFESDTERFEPDREFKSDTEQFEPDRKFKSAKVKLNDGEEIKAILTFKDKEKSLDLEFWKLYESSKSRIIRGGGTYADSYPGIPVNNIVFLKKINSSARFEAYSIIVPLLCISEEIFLKSKRECKLGSNSLAIYSCISLWNVNAEILLEKFKRYFPGVPVLSVNLQCVFEWENVSDEADKCLVRLPSDAVSFTLLTWDLVSKY